jgi:hypothetical protein
MNADSKLGIFEDIGRSGGYLSLLGMGSADVPAVLSKIADVVRTTDGDSFDVRRLLDDRNWRGHLIGAAAALLSDKSASYAPLLWNAFDRGSWVAPQLAVSLYCCDPAFATEAKRRIVTRCPIADEDGFFRGETRDVSAKNLASLLRALAYVPSAASWVASQLAAGDVRELLKFDRDSAAEIVEWWFPAAQARFKEFGRDLDGTA